MSILFITGAVPVKATLPVMVAPFTSSGVTVAPDGAVGAVVFSADSLFPPPHPARVKASASPPLIQIFFMKLFLLMESSH
jgi:hypothetical protein